MRPYFVYYYSYANPLNASCSDVNPVRISYNEKNVTYVNRISLRWPSSFRKWFTDSTINTLMKVFFLEEPLNCTLMDLLIIVLQIMLAGSLFSDGDLFSEYIDALNEISLEFSILLH